MSQSGPISAGGGGPLGPGGGRPLGPVEAPLSPQQRSKIRRLSIPIEPAPGEEAGELNIIPYLDIIMNVLVFVLASVSITFLTQLDTVPPSTGGKGVKDTVKTDALNLAIIIVDDGVAFKTSFGNVAPGCGDEGSITFGRGITVPTKGGKFDYDFAKIRRCARLTKQAGDGEQFQDETQVTVTASRNIEFRYLVGVLDAIRNDDDGELFPEFHLGVTK